MHGSNTIAKPVFADSPAIGQVYVPTRLKKIMDKVETGEVDSDHNKGSDMDDDLQEEDYVIPDEKPKQKNQIEKRRDREAFVPMNVYDL